MAIHTTHYCDDCSATFTDAQRAAAHSCAAMKGTSAGGVPDGIDVGDQAVELLLAKRQGREPEAWALAPLTARAPQTSSPREPAPGPEERRANEMIERIDRFRTAATTTPAPGPVDQAVANLMKQRKGDFGAAVADAMDRRRAAR